MWPRGGLLAGSVPVAKRAEARWEGGENRQEHRKVEAVGVGWESTPSPNLRPPTRLLGGRHGEGSVSPGSEGGRATVREQAPRGELA